jgi:dihydrofolate reductase
VLEEMKEQRRMPVALLVDDEAVAPSRSDRELLGNAYISSLRLGSLTDEFGGDRWSQMGNHTELQAIRQRPRNLGGNLMSATVLYMSMSLDGFIAGPNDGRGNGLGDHGRRLHDWLFTSGEASAPSGFPGRPSGVNGEMFDELMATGAVVVGRRTFDIAGGWAGDHHDGVPIFVVSRYQPDSETAQSPLVSYVTDVETAMTQAKDAAGENDVLVHGARTAQLALAAGVLDELQIHLIPALLGQGRRLFDDLGPEHTELELIRIIDGPGVTHLRYRVGRP